jgi:hypothetical protein
VSKQAAVASVVFVAVQTALLDNLGSSCQRCCDGRIANVWQRLDENFLDFFQCEAVTFTSVQGVDLPTIGMP